MEGINRKFWYPVERIRVNLVYRCIGLESKSLFPVERIRRKPDFRWKELEKNLVSGGNDYVLE